MVSLDDIQARRDEILRIAGEHGGRNVRIFGSFVRGEASEHSDLDLLVTMDDRRSLLDRIAMIHALEDLLHRKVDVVNDKALHPALRERILREEVAL